MGKKDLFKKINKWDKKDKHNKIVDLIESLSVDEQTPELISELGKAYNNLYWEQDEEDDKTYLYKAEEVLKSVENQLKDDYKWHYRIAYTYFYLNNIEKAEFHFREAEKLGDEKYDDYLNAIDLAKEKNITLSDAIYKIWEENGEFGPQYFYSEEEMDSLENFIDNNFGKIESVFHELVSPDIHCDIYVIKPTKERNYYTLVTGGMGAYEMQVPEGFNSEKRAELMINLPPDWDIANEDEKWYWPLRWLKILARLPIEQNTFLGWGHTIPTGQPIEGTDFDCIMLVSATNIEGENVDLELPSGDKMVFYTLVPLFPEETKYKLDNSAEELLGKFDEFDIPYPPIVDLKRPNSCLYYESKSDENLLNQIYWAFTPNKYESLMNFNVDLQTYNEELGNNLVDFKPFTAIFDSSNVKVIYDAYIKSKDDLLENEILLMEEETFSQQPEDGFYYAKILATLNSGIESNFGSLHLLLDIHNTIANKELGDHIFFEGLEVQGYEEDGTPVVYLLLGS